MSDVGVRELRQNLSAYLRRVRRGEAFSVTDRGEEVARLIPSGAHAGLRQRLAARGAAPASAELLAGEKPLAIDGASSPTPATDALRELRDESRG